MKKINYRNQLIILFVWILVVGLLFSTIADKPLAGVIAGTGFNIIPVLFLWAELKKKPRYGLHILTLLLFLVLSALPIFILRIFNWGIDFKQLSLFGISSDFLHRSSNIIYFFMIISAAIGFYREKKSLSK